MSSVEGLLLAAAAVIILGFIIHKIAPIVHAGGDESELPLSIPSIPWSIPIIKSTIPFVFSGAKFFHGASKFAKGRWPLRVEILNDEIYLVQGSKNITSIFTHPGLTVTRAYGIVLEHCFGMEQKAVDVYVADTSGSREKQIPGSNLPSNHRVSYHTHEGLVDGLLGSGVDSIGQRIETTLRSALTEAVPEPNEWIYETDLTTFFEEHLGSAIIEGLFGPLLVSENLSFNQTLWQYDKHVMTLAKRLPKWLIPEAYRLRDRLVQIILSCHEQATQLSQLVSHSGSCSGGDSHPYWGSVMMQKRYKMLLGIAGQDSRSVASTDLAFIWAYVLFQGYSRAILHNFTNSISHIARTVTNVVPSTMTLCTHIFHDETLLSEIRSTVQQAIQPGSDLDFDYKKLTAIPLLSSMYAETLRFGVQIHIPRCSPHQPLSVGGSQIPADKLILINTELAHTDSIIWSTRDGQYPLDTFWARRFLVRSDDPNSGPINRSHVQLPLINFESKHQDLNGLDPSQEHFTLEGLVGSFIPYGSKLSGLFSRAEIFHSGIYVLRNTGRSKTTAICQVTSC
ncbi:hypothetical protein N7493_001314 [Penicillium malachiteum]|uniref:Cytochrome P450 n=1 Tax=Penicillium malachiteum TaxID=1324776 RepID=A0AAD6HUH3_9EURO|nr:hypothetical protein N7493_001314 [Penicillium malachiteum]